MTAFIHPKAHVEGAQIEDGAKVFQFASVFGGAVIGPRTVIGPCAMINGSRIGADCKVSWGVNMGPGFLIGDKVFLGPGVVLCNDRWPRVDKAGFDIEAFDGTRWAIVIERGASIGAYAAIMPGVRIGEGAMIPANAVVTRSVPSGDRWTHDGSTVEITDEMRQLERRMRFVEGPPRPSPAIEGETYAHMTARLDEEQTAMLDAAGVSREEQESLR